MKKNLSIIIAAFAAVLAFAGCGSKESSGSERSYDTADTAAVESAAADYYDGGSDFSSGYSADADYEYDMEEPEFDDAGEYDNASSGGTTKEVTKEEVEEYGSKIIRNASVSLEVNNLEEFSDNLKRTVYDYGGYIESMDINAYDSDYSESRFGYFTVRIPAAKLDDFLSIVKDEGTVTAKSESAEDVTLQYVDVEARIATYEAERDSLMELLDKATSLKDILTIRDKIAEVNYELDSLQRQLKSMQNKVSYSTVDINAKETRTIAGNKGEKTFFTKIGENFLSEMEDGLEMAIDLLIFLITRLPLFVILGLLVFVIVKVVKAIFGKSGKEKASKKSAKGKQAVQGQQQESRQPEESLQPQSQQNPQPPQEQPPAPENAPEENVQAETSAQSGGHFTSNVPPLQSTDGGENQG